MKGSAAVDPRTGGDQNELLVLCQNEDGAEDLLTEGRGVTSLCLQTRRHSSTSALKNKLKK